MMTDLNGHLTVCVNSTSLIELPGRLVELEQRGNPMILSVVRNCNRRQCFLRSRTTCQHALSGFLRNTHVLRR